MKFLPEDKAKKKILELMHIKYIQKTKQELIEILLKSAKTDLEEVSYNNIDNILIGLSKGKFSLDKTDIKH